MSELNKPHSPKELVLPVAEKRQITWSDLGDSFEVMGKVGLAFAIGMSAAGLFCRLADQGKVRVPALSSLLLHRDDQASPTPK